MAPMSPQPYSVHKNVPGDQPDAEEEAAAVALVPDVTRHILVKSSHSTQVLDKAVVLRRIRQRKRVNKFRAVVGALFSSPFADKSDETITRKWVDEPFTSL